MIFPVKAILYSKTDLFLFLNAFFSHSQRTLQSGGSSSSGGSSNLVGSSVFGIMELTMTKNGNVQEH